MPLFYVSVTELVGVVLIDAPDVEAASQAAEQLAVAEHPYLQLDAAPIPEGATVDPALIGRLIPPAECATLLDEGKLAQREPVAAPWRA